MDKDFICFLYSLASKAFFPFSNHSSAVSANTILINQKARKIKGLWLFLSKIIELSMALQEN
jgi:hypothetical protein